MDINSLTGSQPRLPHKLPRKCSFCEKIPQALGLQEKNQDITQSELINIKKDTQ